MNAPIIKAEILPLADKHYGTEIRLHLSNGETTRLDVWVSGGGPSEEACQQWGISRAEWLANVEVDDGWGGAGAIHRMFPCDAHYQSQYEWEVCQQIVSALNKEGINE